jgi:hypothetical protein
LEALPALELEFLNLRNWGSSPITGASVGKTTVARTLLDYFVHQQVSVRAFDTEVPKGTLKRFHPDLTT